MPGSMNPSTPTSPSCSLPSPCLNSSSTSPAGPSADSSRPYAATAASRSTQATTPSPPNNPYQKTSAKRSTGSAGQRGTNLSQLRSQSAGSQQIGVPDRRGSRSTVRLCLRSEPHADPQRVEQCGVNVARGHRVADPIQQESVAVD